MKVNLFTCLAFLSYVVKCTYEAAFVNPFWYFFDFENTPIGRVKHLFFCAFILTSVFLSYKKYPDKYIEECYKYIAVPLILLSCICLKHP